MLPELPRQLKRKEADFGIQFRRWWEISKMVGNFELKHTRGKDTFLFSSVESEQLVIGKAAESTDGILLRLVKGTIGSPDYIGQVEQPSYIVIRYPAFFCVIDIKDFLAEKKRSTSKSLTALRAIQIATYNSI